MSKKPASAEGNAYGGLPRFVSPSAASLANYSEIFGGLANSCSIPFLDVPPAFDGRDAGLLRAGGSGFDYSEVFGSLDFGEFSSPFEEMLAVPRTEESHSGDVRCVFGDRLLISLPFAPTVVCSVDFLLQSFWLFVL